MLKEKKVSALEKYMTKMGYPRDKIMMLDDAMTKLGTEAGFNMKEES